MNEDALCWSIHSVEVVSHFVCFKEYIFKKFAVRQIGIIARNMGTIAVLIFLFSDYIYAAFLKKTQKIP